MFCLNTPINSVSFGQVSFALLKEMLNRGIEPNIFPIGGSFDFSAQDSLDAHTHEAISILAKDAYKNHSREDTALKLWHLNGALESFSNKQALFSFYELDSPTDHEINVVKTNDRVMFSSNYSVEVFKEKGVESFYVPLFFDALNFKRKERKYFSDKRIVFNLCGKFEKRKHHAKILNAWAKKYGNNSEYVLQCALFNPFLKPEDNEALIHNSLKGIRYSNIQILKKMEKNSLYNDFLNSANIVIGMSGGEGWGLPEFHSLALGKHAVMLNAHAYKDYSNEENSVLVEPSGKVDVYDGIFFQEGADFNQGQIFDWEDDAFLDACDKAIERVKDNKLNEAGLKIEEEFTVSKTLDSILDHVEKV